MPGLVLTARPGQHVSGPCRHQLTHVVGCDADACSGALHGAKQHLDGCSVQSTLVLSSCSMHTAPAEGKTMELATERTQARRESATQGPRTHLNDIQLARAGSLQRQGQGVGDGPQAVIQPGLGPRDVEDQAQVAVVDQAGKGHGVEGRPHEDRDGACMSGFIVKGLGIGCTALWLVD